MARGKLNDDQKLFVVQALACFDPPAVVAKALLRDFGVTLSLQGVECYDPGKTAGARLSARWRRVFAETRDRFLTDQASISVAHQLVRLRRLDRMAQAAEEQGNMGLAAKLLEQAAREVGGAFTNRLKHELAGKGGGPLTVNIVHFGDGDAATDGTSQAGGS